MQTGEGRKIDTQIPPETLASVGAAGLNVERVMGIEPT
jgi:hypothetical protein